MHTAHSQTRGASPYEIIFGCQPNTSLDLMFGQKMAPTQFSTINQYRVAKARRDELANLFAKHNLANTIFCKRKNYTEGLGTIHKRRRSYFPIFEVPSHPLLPCIAAGPMTPQRRRCFWPNPPTPHHSALKWTCCGNFMVHRWKLRIETKLT